VSFSPGSKKVLTPASTPTKEPGHRAGLFAFHQAAWEGTAMGRLYMKSLNGHSGPQEYLDAQFSFARADGASKALRSELVGNSVYYAAVEQTILGTGAYEVFALICLVAYDPRDREGYIFGSLVSG
jgi:hypothetical protein